MSVQTVTLYATDSAYVSYEDISKSFQTGEIVVERTMLGQDIVGNKYGLLRFDNDSGVIAKRILKVSLGVFPTELYNPSYVRLGVRLTADKIPKALSDANYYTVTGTKLTSLTTPYLLPVPNLNQYNYLFLNENKNPSVMLYQVTQRGVALTPSDQGQTSKARYTTATTPPVLQIECETVYPAIVYMYPSDNILVDKNNIVRVNWDVSTDYENEVYKPRQIKIKVANLRYRKAGASQYTEVSVTGGADQFGQMFYSFPANTFELANYEWQVSVTSEDDFTSVFSTWKQFTTIDSVSSSQAVSPRSVYLAGNEPNTFIWKHITATGTLQTAAELQSSVNGEDWQELQSVTGGVQQCVIPANTLTGDVKFWRVRTYNFNNLPGQWSEPAPIVVHAAPRPPALNIPEGVPRLTLTWQSQEQQAFEVMAGDWKSGTIYGTAKIYTVPRWFADGAVVVGARVQSGLGLWSEWATMRVMVANQPQTPVALSVRAIPNGVKLVWTGAHDAYTVYRDGKAILSTTQTGCTDWLASGAHRYQVRGINGRFYSLSNTVIEYSHSDTGVISRLDNIEWLILRGRRGDSPARDGNVNKEIALQYLYGRVKPVAEVSPHVTSEHTFDYSFATSTELDALNAMLGSTVVCKSRDSVTVGVLTAVSSKQDWAGIDVTFSIIETDVKEVGGLEDY